LFTFGVAGLWGINGYQPDEWLSCQLFLIANILLFGVVCVVLFTFGVAGLWGINGYQPDEWLSCQLFLIANIL
ncbi:hypothetical protein, partial [Cronobacter malonaticus]|uniref:hypothetical protein n=1 Tax=Cronobacter malonaticus TaxID=413503 RepID=UPI0018F8AE24